MSFPSSELRILQVDDSWSYRVSGTLTPPAGPSLPVSGTIEVRIVPDQLANHADWMSIEFTQKLELNKPDGTREPMPAPAWMFSFVQDRETRDVAIAADNMTPTGQSRIAREPQVFYPGHWSSSTSYQNRLEFSDSEYVENTLNVTGQEAIETEAGVFAAWKAPITSRSPMMGLIEGFDWWTPELGAPAKFATRSQMPDGAVLQITAVLFATSVL